MSYTQSTFGDLQLSLAYRYGETAIPSSGTANRNFWLNKGVQYLARRLNLAKTTSLTISSGIATLPIDFKNVVELYNSNNEYYTRINRKDSAGATGLVYWITGNHTDGFSVNTNSDNDGSFTMEYNYYPADMSATTDKCIIPDSEAVVAYAYGMLRKSETDPLGDATNALDEAENRLSQMIYDAGQNEQLPQMGILQPK